MPLPFPQELVNEIIDQLHDSDPDSKEFHSIALVCRAFRDQTQSHSFRSPNFSFKKNDGSGLAKLQGRRRILDRNPLIAQYVRHLYFPIVQDTLWVFDHPEFIRMMEMIAQASSDRIEDRLRVHLVGSGGDEDKYGVGARPRIPNRFLLHIFDSIGPYVEVLNISSIVDMPCCWITDCPNLFKLDVSYASLSKSDSKPICFPLPQPHLVNLSFLDDYVEDVNHMIEFIFNPSLVCTFVSQFDGEYCFDGVVAILDICKDSLEYLQLFWNDEGVRIADLYDLSTVPNLKDLFLKIDMSVEDQDDVLEDLCAFLNSSSNDNKLEDISLDIMSNSQPDVAPLAHLAMANWNMLDSTLIKLSGGKRLKLDIHFYYCLEQDFGSSTSATEQILNVELEDWIAERLPEASKQPHMSLGSKICLIDQP